jgi:hypothetical protein
MMQAYGWSLYGKFGVNTGVGALEERYLVLVTTIELWHEDESNYLKGISYTGSSSSFWVYPLPMGKASFTELTFENAVHLVPMKQALQPQ